MPSIVRRIVACVFVAVAFAASPARAQNYGDIWWVPTESGWGLQIAHQGNILFLTWYIFKTDRTPVWVTAALFQQGSSSTFTGNLIATTGPYYGSPVWAPPAENRTAGTATFTATSITTATLTYTIDGVSVTKTIQRYAFNFFNLSGNYIGSFLAVQHNCTNPLANGPFTGSGQFTITHAPNQQVTIVANLSDNLHSFTCTYTGTYGQDGRLGNISGGSYTCTDGHAGAFSATEIELASQGGILGRYSGTNVAQGCQLTGGFGGLKP